MSTLDGWGARGERLSIHRFGLEGPGETVEKDESGIRNGNGNAERTQLSLASDRWGDRARSQQARGRHSRAVAAMGRCARLPRRRSSQTRRAEIRADFVHKVGLAAKQLGEGLYWLRLLDKLALLRVEPAVLREADELIAIPVASARTARAR